MLVSYVFLFYLGNDWCYNRIGKVGDRMNHRQLEIRDFILSLARKTLGITNEDIKKLIQRYSNDTLHSLEEVKTEIQTKFLELNKEIFQRTDESNLFSAYQINSPEEFLSFLKTNREYGFLSFQIPIIHSFPLGPLKGPAIKNVITTYDDYRIVSFLQDFYSKIPIYERKNKVTLSDTVDLSSKYLLRTKWKLQDYETTLKYMIGTDYDFLELEAAYFESLGYNVQRYYFSSIRDSHENHFFLAYEKMGKWYYFEPFFESFYGIHEFSSKEELEQVVISKFLVYYTIQLDNQPIYQKDFSLDQKNLYQRACLLRDKAIYDYRISCVPDDENPKFQEEFLRSSYEKWMEASQLIQQLPRTYEFYQLQRVEKPKKGIDYNTYQSFLYYQNKVKDFSLAISLYQKEQYLLSFAISGVLTPGICSYYKNLAFYTPVELPVAVHVLSDKKKEQQLLNLFHQSLFDIAYSTFTMGRSMIKLDSKGNFIQIKGVDLFDTKINVNQYPMLNTKTPYALQITSEKKMRFRGVCNFQTLYNEKLLHEKFLLYGFLCPKDIKITEFDSSFLSQYRLPQKSESVESYLKRVGVYFKLEPGVIDTLETLFPNGIQFGQVERHIQNIFRISDVKYCLENKQIDKLKVMFDFSRFILPEAVPNLQSYLLYFAKTIGTQLAILFNQNYFYKMNERLDDLTLSGEICDDKLISYYESLEAIDEKERKKKQFPNIDFDKCRTDLRISYFFQFFSISSSLKVILDSFQLIMNRSLLRPVLIVFLGHFFSSLSYEKQDEFFQFYHTIKEEQSLEKVVSNMFSTESHYFKNNKEFFRKMFAILEDFSDNPDAIVNKTSEILKDQEFLNEILIMPTEERFVVYMKRRFKDSKLSLDTITLDQLCDDSKIGLLLRKEPIMVHTLSTLISYQLKDFSLFCEVGKNLIELSKTDDLEKKEFLRHKLAIYEKKEKILDNVIVLDLDGESLTTDDLCPKQLTPAISSSGMATPIYLFFVLLGTIFIVLGIALSFVI